MGNVPRRREFLYFDDIAYASVFMMKLDKEIFDLQVESAIQNHINIGYRSGVTISDPARAIADIVGYDGEITCVAGKPDGAPRKWIDSRKLLQFGRVLKNKVAGGFNFRIRSFFTAYFNSRCQI